MVDQKKILSACELLVKKTCSKSLHHRLGRVNLFKTFIALLCIEVKNNNNVLVYTMNNSKFIFSSNINVKLNMYMCTSWTGKTESVNT